MLARVRVAREDAMIFAANDECLANNRPLWQSVVSRALLNLTNLVSDRWIDR